MQDFIAIAAPSLLVLALSATICALVKLREKERDLNVKKQHKIGELTEELRYWITQKGCGCLHPGCSTCKDVIDAYDLIKSAHPSELNKDTQRGEE